MTETMLAKVETALQIWAPGAVVKTSELHVEYIQEGQSVMDLKWEQV